MDHHKKFDSLKEFYPFYLTEHNHPTSRILHFIGTALVFIFLFAGMVTQVWWILVLIPVFGYGFAWVGHFFFERNKPATFQHPAYSLASDFKLFFELIQGKRKFNPANER
jgi:hypothetical protein